MDNDSELTYLVPTRISTRFEFIPGFGWKELVFCLIAAAAAYAVTLVLGLAVGISQGARFIFTAAATLMGFAVVRENPLTGYSILQMVLNYREFSKRQKRYLYEYHREAE